MNRVAYNVFSETFREAGGAGGDKRKTSRIEKILAFAKERGVAPPELRLQGKVVKGLDRMPQAGGLRDIITG